MNSIQANNGNVKEEKKKQRREANGYGGRPAIREGGIATAACAPTFPPYVHDDTNH